MNLSIVLLSLISLLLPRPAADLTLTVQVTNIKGNSGSIGLLLFNQSEGFPSDHSKAIGRTFIPVAQAAKGYTFSGLKPGSYAVAVVHDANNNGKMDTGMFGIPKEGYGVSNDAVRTLGPPLFTDAVVSVKASSNISIPMHY